MIIRLAVALLMLCALTGCAAQHIGTDLVVSLSKAQAEQVAKIKSVGANVVGGCGYDTGFARGLFGSQYEYATSLYYQDAADELDELCQSFPDTKWQENQNLGLYVGSKLRAEFYSIKEVQERVLKALPIAKKYLGLF